MKWKYKFNKNDFLSESEFTHTLKHYSEWRQTKTILLRRSCLTSKVILPFTDCMKATAWTDGFHSEPETYWCTVKEFMVWNLTRDE